MAQEFKRPEYIEGGCLCSSIRWRLSFPPDGQYPPTTAHCHCTYCRKGMGAFIATYIIADPAQLAWTSKSTYKEYSSTENGRRGFCTNCGGTIAWRGVNNDNMVLVTAASVDEEILGNKELGLFQGAKQSWFCKNIIPGIDDGVTLTTVKYITTGPEVIETGKA